MTLEDAIRHCEKLVYDFNRLKQIKAVTLEECKQADEWLQLAEWLKELKAVQDIIKQHDSDSMQEDYWYIDKIRMEVLK